MFLTKTKFRVLGLDNSRYSTGWGVVEIVNGVMTLIDYGYLDTKNIKDEGDTLVYIENELTKLLQTYNPDYISAEAMFVGKNSVTAMTLSHIHGVMLLIAKKMNIPIRYYSIMTIKSCILNGIKTKKEDGTKKDGNEMKKEVSDKVIEILGPENFIKKYNFDVTDALSCAITFVKKDGQPIIKISKKKVKKNDKE